MYCSRDAVEIVDCTRLSWPLGSVGSGAKPEPEPDGPLKVIVTLYLDNTAELDWHKNC